MAARAKHLGPLPRGRFTPYLEQINIRAVTAGLTETNTGELLLSYTSDCLFQLGRAQGPVTKHNLAAESKAQQGTIFSVHALCIDREGNIWAGTIGDGLMAAEPAARHNAAAGELATRCREAAPVVEDGHGESLVWEPHDGLFRSDGGRAECTQFTPRLLDGTQGDWRVDSMLPGSQLATCGLALSTAWRVIVRGASRNIVLPGIEAHPSPLCGDRQGQVWLGTLNELVRFSRRQCDDLSPVGWPRSMMT